MSSSPRAFTPLPPLAPRRRLAHAGIAALASGALVSTLLLAFDRASPRLWLVPTPDHLELVSRCDRLPDRGARTTCAREVVAVLLERAQREARLAQR